MTSADCVAGVLQDVQPLVVLPTFACCNTLEVNSFDRFVDGTLLGKSAYCGLHKQATIIGDWGCTSHGNSRRWRCLLMSVASSARRDLWLGRKKAGSKCSEIESPSVQSRS